MNTTTKPTFFVKDDRLHVRGLDPTENNALALSIMKWEFILSWLQEYPDSNLEDAGTKTCALCHVYIDGDENDEDHCVGCPVYSITGRQYCAGTPYAPYPNLENAQRQIAFLKSLQT